MTSDTPYATSRNLNFRILADRIDLWRSLPCSRLFHALLSSALLSLAKADELCSTLAMLLRLNQIVVANDGIT